MDVKEPEDWLWMEGESSACNATSSVDDHSHILGLDPWLGIRQLLAEAGQEIEPSEAADSLSTDGMREELLGELMQDLVIEPE